MSKFKSKIKICPDCSLKQGQKTKTCKKCNHKFTFTKKITNGKKCPQCSQPLKKRAKNCEKCQYTYPIKNKKKWTEIKDWKKLKINEIFYLIKRSGGPYYLTQTDEKIDMFERGRFKVRQICDKGISAHSECGLAFIYLGPEYICPMTNLTQQPYKIFKKSSEIKDV